jgi:plasmid stability protein
MPSLITVQSNDCIDGEPLTIRNLDNSHKACLCLQAARRDRSMAPEARANLAQTPKETELEQNLAAVIHQRFESLDGEDSPIPARQQVRTPPDFGE